MNKSIKNVVYGLSGQFIILALGIVIPRFILQNYSDEANGLLNAINQIFTYLALIEAGIGQATLQALYKPVVEKDNQSISAIMSATQRYYRKLIGLYAGAVIALAFVYPLIITVEDKSAISIFGSTYWSVFFLILFQGASGVIAFYFVAAYKQLFIADGQNYVISNLTTMTQILVAVTKLVLISVSANIVLLQFSYLLINIVVAILYGYMFRKKYKQVNCNAKPDSSAMAQRNSFLVHEISNAIFSGTDILLLSVFCSLKTASIYAIYNLVFSALNQLIGQVHNGCYYILGQSYNKNRETYSRIHDTYDTLYVAMVFTFVTAAYLLINPFIAIYTRGVSDINYVDTYLPVLFAMIQLLSCCRITASNLVKIAGHAKKTISRTIAESVIHIVVSVVLVQFMGIYGVLIGTIVALLYRTNDFIIYSNVKILRRSPLKQYVMVGSNFVLFGVIAFVFSKIHIHLENYLNFVVIGFVVTFVLVLLYFGMALLLSSEARHLMCKIFPKIRLRLRSGH